MRKITPYSWYIFPIVLGILFAITFLPLPDYFKVLKDRIYPYSIFSPVNIEIKKPLQKREKIFVYDGERIAKSILSMKNVLKEILLVDSTEITFKEESLNKIFNYLYNVSYEGVIDDTINTHLIKVKVGDTIVDVEISQIKKRGDVLKNVIGNYLKGVGEKERRTIMNFLSHNFISSIYYDSTISNQFMETKRERIKIEKGEKIYTKGTILDEETFFKIKKINKFLNEQYNKNILNIFMRFLIFTIVLLFLWFYIFVRKRRYFSLLNMALISFLIIVVFIAGKFLMFFSSFLIPFVLIALITSFLFGIEIAFLSSLIALFLFFWGLHGYENFYIYFLFPVSGVIISSLYTKTKKDIYKIFIGVIAGTFITIFMLFLNNKNGSFNIVEDFYLFANNLITITLAFISLPIFEKITKIYTTMTIFEYGDLNHPLLRELAFKAPGTYYHSILVGLLAEAAAREIGADPYIARVGGYYHDIGKLRRPEYFIENQKAGVNVHENLSFKISALIIISHVKDGIEIAKRYKLPKPIMDIISQHHGTTFLEYFYRESLLKGEKLSEESFRYPGPKPQTREAAVVMIADTVEAAIRSHPDQKPAKLIDTIHELIKAKMDDGQFEFIELTIADINKIRKIFFKMMMGLHHTRVQYK